MGWVLHIAVAASWSVEADTGYIVSYTTEYNNKTGTMKYIPFKNDTYLLVGRHTHSNGTLCSNGETRSN